MQHQEFEPPEALRDSIKCFWYNSRDYGKAGSAFEVVPDGYAEIIFYFGDILSITHNGVVQPLPSPFMMGLLNQPVIFDSKNRTDIIGIRCFPWTVFNLLGLQPGKDGVRIFEHPIAALQPVLSKYVYAGDIAMALAELIMYLPNVRPDTANYKMLFKAGAAMRAAKGTMPVSKVAETAHTTLRTLERNFKDSSGYSVKDVSGLMRFEQVRNKLWHHPDSNLAGLAYELGFSDQSHLSREFKRYSGTTPAAFAKKAKTEKPFVSDDFVAFIQD